MAWLWSLSEMILLMPRAPTIGNSISIGKLVVSRTTDISQSKTAVAITQASATSEDTIVLAGSLASKNVFLIPLWFATKLRPLLLRLKMLLFRKFLFLLVTLLPPLLLSSQIAATSRFAVKDPDATSINLGGTTGALTTKVLSNNNADVSSQCVPHLANRESRDAESATPLRMTHSTPLPSRKTTPTMTGVTASCSRIAPTPPSSPLPHQSSLSLPSQVAVRPAITLARTSVPSIL